MWNVSFVHINRFVLWGGIWCTVVVTQSGFLRGTSLCPWVNVRSTKDILALRPHCWTPCTECDNAKKQCCDWIHFSVLMGQKMMWISHRSAITAPDGGWSGKLFVAWLSPDTVLHYITFWRLADSFLSDLCRLHFFCLLFYFQLIHSTGCLFILLKNFRQVHYSGVE